MKKFLYKIALFFLFVVALDVLCGFVLSEMVAHSKSGENYRNNYIINQNTSEVMIIGSSRALHHYNPQIINDSLHMSCYNCGQIGNGVILNYGIAALAQKRYTPTMIIYDIMPEYDLLEGEDNHKYLGILKPYYDRDEVRNIFEDVDSKEKYKMISSMYRYNSKLYPIIRDFLIPYKEDIHMGFLPEYKEMDTLKVTNRNRSVSEYKYDSLKMTYLSRFTEMYPPTTKLVFVVSPIYNGMDSKVFSPVLQLCMEKGIPFIDFSNNPKYVHHPEFFRDGGHMNAKGADEFTKDLVQLISK